MTSAFQTCFASLQFTLLSSKIYDGRSIQGTSVADLRVSARETPSNLFYGLHAAWSTGAHASNMTPTCKRRVSGSAMVRTIGTPRCRAETLLPSLAPLAQSYTFAQSHAVYTRAYSQRRHGFETSAHRDKMNEQLQHLAGLFKRSSCLSHASHSSSVLLFRSKPMFPPHMFPELL